MLLIGLQVLKWNRKDIGGTRCRLLFGLKVWRNEKLFVILQQRVKKYTIMETRKFKQVPSISRLGGRNPKIPSPVIVSSGKKTIEYERTISRPMRADSRPIGVGEPINWDEVYC